MSRCMARCGYSADLSLGVDDRAMFHADNAYFYPAVRIHSRRLKTNTVSNTAFRGFGGPQGMIVRRAHDGCRSPATLGLDPLDVRKRNFYGRGRDVTPYGMKVARQHRRRDWWPSSSARSDYRRRREAVARVQCREPDPEEGHRADAGEVRHLLHPDPSQPGGRAGPSLYRRLGAAEPRRHRDGAGALHQGGAGRGRGVRHRRSTG